MSGELDWQRPHPLTVIVLVATFVSGNAMPLVVAVAFGGSGFGFDTVAIVAGGLIGGVRRPALFLIPVAYLTGVVMVGRRTPRPLLVVGALSTIHGGWVAGLACGFVRRRLER